MNRDVVKLQGIVLSLGMLFSASSASATDTRTGYFFKQRAYDPIKLQTGLPEPAGRIQSNNELQVSVLHSNVFMGGLGGNERLILDGESSQLNLRYSRRINRCWQINAATAYLAHSEGWFDQPVDDWHQFFGLPDAQRGEWPNNKLEYGYEKGDEKQLLDGERHGFGDIQLQMQRSVGCQQHSSLMRFGAKLPLGKPEHFFGSGSLDLFVDVQSPWRAFRPQSRWQWSGSVGLLLAGGNDLLADQHPLAMFGVAGVNAAINKRLTFIGQLDWHTPMFDSELRELGEPGGQLSLGLRYKVARGAFEVSFSEDAVIDTAPDIVLRLAWESHWPKQ